MNALYPSPEQLTNWQYFSTLILVIALAFAALAWVLDRGVDLAISWWNTVRSQSIVIRFAWPIVWEWTVLPAARGQVVGFEARRQTLRRAMGGR